MIDTEEYEGVRTPFGIIPTEDILKMLEPIRERDNKIAELNAEVERLTEQYTELREALVGDSPNWTHEELIERALELIDND